MFEESLWSPSDEQDEEEEAEDEGSGVTQWDKRSASPPGYIVSLIGYIQ
jgi:hypothetical protein